MGCDLTGHKDALGALDRAKSRRCKELIHNVSCIGKAGKLYNTEIRNSCPFGKIPGRGFKSVPYEEGRGPPVRVAFLFSIHGRAVRQLKRLFKAIYHTDHYYYIHVDSVKSLCVCVHACMLACTCMFVLLWVCMHVLSKLHAFSLFFFQRSDYLHRKLYEELSDFPNVYFPTWRMATIWGGASLLQMLLRALHDLEYILTSWEWDYFINLSESDYPLR